MRSLIRVALRALQEGRTLPAVGKFQEAFKRALHYVRSKVTFKPTPKQRKCSHRDFWFLGGTPLCRTCGAYLKYGPGNSLILDES